MNLSRPISMVDCVAPNRTRYTIKLCPFCGSEPEHATPICGRYIVSCSNENCDTQKAGATVDEAWQKWNTRK